MKAPEGNFDSELSFNWHKEPMEENLTKKIGDLINEVEEYIASNPDWVYYFLNPLGSGNEEICKCMTEHPDDWEDYILFSVINMSSASLTIDINIDDGSELGICLKRYIYLPIFSETVNRNKKLYEGNLISSRLSNLKEDIDRLKEILKEKEDKVKELEGLNK